MLPQQGARVQSLVRELNLAHQNSKVLSVPTKICPSQINKQIFKFLKRTKIFFLKNHSTEVNPPVDGEAMHVVGQVYGKFLYFPLNLAVTLKLL